MTKRNCLLVLLATVLCLSDAKAKDTWVVMGDGKQSWGLDKSPRASTSYQGGWANARDIR